VNAKAGDKVVFAMFGPGPGIANAAAAVHGWNRNLKLVRNRSRSPYCEFRSASSSRTKLVPQADINPVLQLFRPAESEKLVTDVRTVTSKGPLQLTNEPNDGQVWNTMRLQSGTSRFTSYVGAHEVGRSGRLTAES
jgi:hypothetical protein